MSAVDLVTFAFGALRGHRLRTALSLLGVGIGVAAVIVLTSLGEGARVYVSGEFASLGSNLLIVVPGKTETTGAPLLGGTPNDLTIDDALSIERRVPQVRRVAPLYVGNVTARFGERSRDTTVIGTTDALEEVRRLTIGTGRYLPPSEAVRGERICVLGAKLQGELFPGRNPLGEILRVGEERFRVVGVMAPRGTSLGIDLDEVVHVPVASAMRMFDATTLFRILAEVRAYNEIEAAREAVLAVLVERHGVEDVTVFTQDAVLDTFGDILGILTAALGGIAAISLSVAGIGIMNVMLVSVAERTREIGLLKAVGVSPGQVLLVFLVEAVAISTSGGALGLAAGFGGGQLIRAAFPAFPAQPPDWAVAGAVAVSIAVGALFGAIPARRAARLEPVVALGRG